MFVDMNVFPTSIRSEGSNIMYRAVPSQNLSYANYREETGERVKPCWSPSGLTLLPVSEHPLCSISSHCQAPLVLFHRPTDCKPGATHSSVTFLGMPLGRAWRCLLLHLTTVSRQAHSWGHCGRGRHPTSSWPGEEGVTPWSVKGLVSLEKSLGAPQGSRSSLTLPWPTAKPLSLLCANWLKRLLEGSRLKQI